MPPTATLLFLWFFALSPSTVGAAEVWYERPATRQGEALPISNGRFTAWVDGGTETCRLQLQAEAAATPPLPEAQTQIAENPTQSTTGPAELALDWLDAELPATRYRRSLDLATGVAVTQFQRGGAGITLTTFCSAVDDLLVVHLRANKPGALNFRVRFGRPWPRSDAGQAAAFATVEDRRVLVMENAADDPPAFPAARIWVFPMESEVTPGTAEITVRGEGEALILCAITRSSEGHYLPAVPADRLRPLGFGGDEPPDLSRVWSGLLERQQTAHRREMERSSLDLGGVDGKATPTDARLQAVRQGASDPALIATLFDCGRYQRLWKVAKPPADQPAAPPEPDRKLAAAFLQAVRTGPMDQAGARLTEWLQQAVGPNLLDRTSPDGNAMVAEGIAGMLIQSQSQSQNQADGEFTLLPHLPKDWPTGKATGLPVRGGYRADFSWKEGRVTDYRLTRDPGLPAGKATLRVNGETKEVNVGLND